MAEVNLTLNRIDAKGAIIPPTVAIYIADYYTRHFTILEDNVPIDAEGNILLSPLPTQVVDSEMKYVLKAVNKSCGYEYEQALIINAYCPIGYRLSDDETICILEESVAPTPPTSYELAVSMPGVSYTACGSYVYDTGFNIDGTGASVKIDADYTFWHNLTADCSDGNTTAGPLNRSGVWVAVPRSNQDIGYSVCISKESGQNYFVGVGCDNVATIKINGVTVVAQDAEALDAQYGVTGAAFKVWHIYPITSLLREGYNLVEVIGHNDGGDASLGAEIYSNTAYEIAHSNSYGDLNLVFSSKDYVGRPIMIGNGGIGFSCPDGYALDACSSPLVCRKIITAPIQYG